jgi:serine/threonine-protein kinase
MTQQSRYKRVALIGEGGMAQVYLTLSDELGVSKLAVVKQLRPELANDREHRAMFLDEARLAVRLHHPNVVQTYEVGERDGTYFMAMEYLEGQPLNLVLQRSTREHFPMPLHYHIVREVLRGLVYAHELEDFGGEPLAIVHRDVSPHNVFLTYDGQVKLVDFGIAKAKSSTERTRTGVFKGKATYSSPEQALGEAVDPRADVWSVGVLLWEALARRRMWGDRGDTAILVELVNGRRPKLADAAPDAPQELVAICECALGQSPDDRFATSREFLDALEAFLEAQPTKVTAKELGAHVSATFESERERIRRAVEEQTRLAGSVSAIRVTPGHGPPSMPTLMQLAGIAPEGSESGARRSPSRRSRRPNAFFGGALALAGIGVAAWVAVRSRAGEGAQKAAMPAAVVPSAVAAPTPSGVRIQVQTDPESASVLFDGQPFDPAQSLPRDSAPHQLAISAPGYETRTMTVVLDEDRSLSVALRPAAAPHVDAKAPAARPKRPGAGGKRPTKSIDEESPY